MQWSPLEIKVMLHCYCSPLAYDGPENPEIVKEVLQKLHFLGLIDRTTFPNTTPAGDKLVAMWCETPVPKQVYIDPRFEVTP